MALKRLGRRRGHRIARSPLVARLPVRPAGNHDLRAVLREVKRRRHEIARQPARDDQNQHFIVRRGTGRTSHGINSCCTLAISGQLSAVSYQPAPAPHRWLAAES